jgi:hypothetical protein
MNRAIVFSLSTICATAACDGGEAPTVDLAVETMDGALPATTNDLGWTISVSRYRAAISDIQFTIEGEMHDDKPVAGNVVLDHPGHSAGGDVTGELAGDFIVDLDGTSHELGIGTLIVGDYRGANLTFRAATDADDLPAGDPLIGHYFHVAGTSTKDAMSVAFDAVLDLDEPTLLAGAIFESTITESSTVRLALSFLPEDPSEHDSVFDGLDFSTLPADGAGTRMIRPGTTEHNILRRSVQVHDHYAVYAR